jgi:hypothetical protein
MQHVLSEVETNVLTELAKDTSGVEQQLAGIEDLGLLPCRYQIRIQLPLPLQASICKAGVRYLNGQRWQHFLRVPYEEDVAGFLQESEIDIDQMMCHVFEEQALRVLSCLPA